MFYSVISSYFCDYHDITKHHFHKITKRRFPESFAECQKIGSDLNSVLRFCSIEA